MSRIVRRMQPSHQPIQILPEPQNFTYICFCLSDTACPDCSRQLLSNVWRWEKLIDFNTFTLSMEPLQYCDRIYFNFQPQGSKIVIHCLDSEIAPQYFERFETLFGNTTHKQSFLLAQPSSWKFTDSAFSKNFLVKAVRDKTLLWNRIFRLQRKPHHPSSLLGYPSRILIAVPFRSETIGRALKQTS